MAVTDRSQVARVIKSSFRELVARCGGQVAAAEIAGVDQALISRYCSRDNPHIVRGDIVAALELAIGDQVMTRASADLHGYELVPKDTVASTTILNRHIGEVTRASANIIEALIEAQRDGMICEWDRAILTERLNEARKVLTLLEADTNLSSGILPIRSRV